MLCPACHACVRGGRRAGIVARMSTFTRHPLTAYLYAKMGLFHVSIVSPIGVSARLRCYGLHVICLCNYSSVITAVITCNYRPPLPITCHFVITTCVCICALFFYAPLIPMCDGQRLSCQGNIHVQNMEGPDRRRPGLLVYTLATRAPGGTGGTWQRWRTTSAGR